MPASVCTGARKNYKTLQVDRFKKEKKTNPQLRAASEERATREAPTPGAPTGLRSLCSRAFRFRPFDLARRLFSLLPTWSPQFDRAYE